jgi:CRP/FNR family transcriptional regulator, cyclic AMP receptor protein
MPANDGRPQDGSDWPARPARGRSPGTPPLFVYVLDADDELGRELDVRMRIAARQLATARALDAKTGACELGPWLRATQRGPGLLILDGLLAVHTRTVDRTVTELVGTGDLLQPEDGKGDDDVPCEATYLVLQPSRLALLDDDFAQRVLPWPQIAHALLRRSERRCADLRVMRAICGQPRLEVRLVLLFWHLAARWGRVEPDGLRITLPLTHRLLGQLVAAERPSISNALGRLGRAGLVTGDPGDWHLHGTLDDQLERLIEHASLPEPGRIPSAFHRRMASGS